MLQPQGADPAQLSLLMFLLREPGILVIELVAEAVEQGVDAVVNQTPFTKGERRRFQQGVTHGCGEVLQLWFRIKQCLEPCRSICELAFQLSCKLRNPSQSVGDSDQIAGAGMASSCTARQPFEIPHGAQQSAQRLTQGPVLHKAAHHGLALLDRSKIHQWGFDPAPKATPAHGGEGAIDRPE